MEIARVQIPLTGFLGGPGVNTYYFVGDAPDMTALHDMYDNLKVAFPEDLTVHFPTSGHTIESTTGALVGGWAADPEDDVVGENVGIFINGVGTLITWQTGSIVDGRLLRGRTFLVPVCADQFDVDGQLTEPAQAFVQTAGQNLVDATSPGLLVWHRPKSTADGEALPIGAASVSRKAAILRSRRD